MGSFMRSVKFYHNSLFNKYYFVRLYCEKVPQNPHNPRNSYKSDSKSIKIELSSIRYLERLSLVNFGNYEGIKILESSIKFAEKLLQKNTTGIEPLVSVLENRTLLLRDDVVNEGNNKSIVLKNAKVTEEEYFVAPPGNIPMEPDQIEYQEDTKKKTILK